MYKLFNRNTLIAFIMLPVMLLVYRIRVISTPSLGLALSDADLYTPLWQATFGHISSVSNIGISVAIALTFITMLIVNNTSSSYRFSRNVTYLPGFVFIVLSSGFVIGQGLHPVQLFIVLFAIGMHRIFEVVRPDTKPYRYCFEAMLDVSIGSLFWAKGLWFVPFIVVCAGMLRVLNIRAFLCMMWGLLAPLVIFGAYAYVTDSFTEYLEAYEQALVVPVAFYKTWMMGKTFLLVSALVLFLAVVSALRNIASLSIWQSRMARVVVWTVIYPAILIITPYFSFELQLFIAAGGSLLVSVWLQRQRSIYFSEIGLTFYALFTLFMQWNI